MNEDDRIIASRAKLARATKAARRNPYDESAANDLRQARAEYTEHMITAYVGDLVAKAPALTAEQLARLAALFSGPSL